MEKKLYVGNLAYSVSETDLKDLFAKFGEVHSAQVITDRDTGRSKGFGFVELDSSDAAQKAVDEMHGTNQWGRDLTVNIARPKESRDSRSSARY